MQKIINFRSIFILFVISLLTIYFAVKVNISFYYLFGLAFPLLYIIYILFKKKYGLTILSILILIFFFTYPYLYIKNYSTKSLEDKELLISGCVQNLNNVDTKFSYITLNEVYVLFENNNGAYIKGNISVPYINNQDEKLSIGDKIVFLSQLEKVEALIDGKINSYYLSNNIRYEVISSIDSTDVTVIKGNLPLNEAIKEYNKKLLINNLGFEKGNLALGILYGDRSDVNDDLLNIFKSSGVMHIFAVSGLHISLIVAILYFLLKKFKLNNIFLFFIIFIFLSLYCYLCSFSAPVVRASIMSLVVLFAKIVKRKNDFLTTFSFAGLIILIFNPLSLFDVGFQMSFVAVFAIILFTKPINKIKISNKLIKNIVSIILISLIVQLALMPIFSEYYGCVAVWSVLGNLVTLPIFSLFYSILFCINLLSVIFPFLQFLYFIPYAMLSLIIELNYLVSLIPYSFTKLYSWGVNGTILYYMFLFALSRFVLLIKKYKIIIILVLSVSSFLSIYNNAKPFVSYENVIHSYSNYEKGFSSLLLTQDDNCYLINPKITKYNIKKIKNELNLKKINKLSGIFFTEDYIFEAMLLKPLLDEYYTTIYLPSNHNSFYNLKQYYKNIEVLGIDEVVSFSFFDVKYMYYNEYYIGALFNFNNFKYFEFDHKVANNVYIYDFTNSYLNFDLDCVKINGTTDSGLKDAFKTKKFVTDSQTFFIKK